MRFNRGRSNIACSFISGSSGSPENRTQRHLFIGQVRATSPRLPFPVGHPGVEPGTSCSQSRRATICTSARVSPVRTAGFEPAISRSPTWRDTRLRHVLSSTARTLIAVGREVLESSSPALQTGATPSQLPTQQKKPGVFGDTGLFKSPATSMAECHKRQWRTGRVFAG